MIKLIILGLVLVAVACEPRPAPAGELIIHTHTWHDGNSQGLERFTPGIGYETDAGYRFGALRNSFGVPGVYAVKSFPINPSFRFGIGAITGYRWAGEKGLRAGRGSVIPLVGAEYDVTDNLSIVWFGSALNVVFKINVN